MKKRNIARRRIRCENGEEAALRYRLVEEKRGGITRYGAEIVMRRGEERECAAVRDITVSYRRIRAFLALLSRNAVTPCTLREIVEDELNNSQKGVDNLWLL